MTIELIRMNSEKNALNKQYENLGLYTAYLKKETSITDPVFELSDLTDLIVVKDVNYCYLAEFQRFYFVNDIVSTANGLWEFHCHVDVLMSFKDFIKNQMGVVKRNSSMYNLMLDDGSLKAYSNPIIERREFPTGFSGSSYVLIVAGNPYTPSVEELKKSGFSDDEIAKFVIEQQKIDDKTD